MAVNTIKELLGKVKGTILRTRCFGLTPGISSALYLESVDKIISNYYTNVEGNPNEVDTYKEDLSVRLKDFLTRYKEEIIILPGVISSIENKVSKIFTPEEITDILSVVSKKDK